MSVALAAELQIKRSFQFLSITSILVQDVASDLLDGLACRENAQTNSALMRAFIRWLPRCVCLLRLPVSILVRSR